MRDLHEHLLDNFLAYSELQLKIVGPLQTDSLPYRRRQADEMHGSFRGLSLAPGGIN